MGMFTWTSKHQRGCFLCKTCQVLNSSTHKLTLSPLNVKQLELHMKENHKLTFFNVTIKETFSWFKWKAIVLFLVLPDWTVQIKWFAKIEFSTTLHRRSQIKHKARQIKSCQLRGATHSNWSNRVANPIKWTEQNYLNQINLNDKSAD